MGAANSATLAARATVAARARHQYANNPYATAAVETFTSAMTGAAGIRPQSAHSEPAIRAETNACFTAWAEDVTGDGRVSFSALQAGLARGLARDGEAFIHMRATPEGLRLHMLDPEQVDPTLHRDLGRHSRIVAGIEFDADGRRVAYHTFEDSLD
jgi:capsid protein